VLFTSGSTGAPKKVAVSCEAFLEDVSGCKADAHAASKGVTVSYIALSHSSDRYKVWQHVASGGRVGLAHFDAAQWAWREGGKEARAGVSPVAELFAQVKALRPTSMALPPNIWAGLHGLFRAAVTARRGTAAATVAATEATKEVEAAEAMEALEAAALDDVASVCFGPPSLRRLTALATGGAPTPTGDWAFATRFAAHLGCGVSDSFGVTEAGAVTSGGRQQDADKFAKIEVRLVDFTLPLEGGKGVGDANGGGDDDGAAFLTTDKPFPRGEVVVRSPSLALGYLGDPSATAQAFITVRAASTGGRSVLPPGRWYRTGDLGAQDATGKLSLLDRCSAVKRLSGGRGGKNSGGGGGGGGVALVVAAHEASLEDELSEGGSSSGADLRGCVLSLVHVGPAGVQVVVTIGPAAGGGAAGEGGVDRGGGSPSAAEKRLEAARSTVLGSAAWLGLEAELAGRAELALVVVDHDWAAQGLLTGTLKKARKKIAERYFPEGP